MKVVDALLAVALLAAVVVVVLEVRAPRTVATDVASEAGLALSERLDGLDARLTSKQLAGLDRSLRELESAVSDLEARAETVTIGTGGASGQVRQAALEVATFELKEFRGESEIADTQSEKLLECLTSHHVRVLQDPGSEADSFATMFEELKEFLDGDQLRVVLTKLGPDRER